jgi:hypothetical protein
VTLIASKRLQQALFEVAASANRAAGSGGGSGLTPLQYLGQGADVAADTITTAGYTLVPGLTVTFALPRTAQIYVAARSTGKTAGAGGTFAYGAFFIDSAQIDTFALWDKGVAGYAQCTMTGSIGASYLLAPGTHSADIRVSVDAGQTWTNYKTVLDVYMLAAA